MIETAGKDREENLERFWTGFPMERASKALITKQLKNLLCGLFVNAKDIYFSDLKVTVDFVSSMFCDVKRTNKKKVDDEELSFKHRSVFEVIEKLSFLSCEFEEGVIEWITKKFKSINTLVFNRCQLKNFLKILPLSFYSQPLNPKKCKFYDNLRFLVVDVFEKSVSANLERYKTDEEKKFIEKFIDLTPTLLSSGFSVNEGEQTAYLHRPVVDNKEIPSILQIIPEHVIVICIQEHHNSLYTFFRTHWRNSSKDLKLFGMVDSSFPIYSVLGFDNTNYHFKEKKPITEIMDIFYMGFNFWNCSATDQLQYLAIIVIYYYEDEELLKFLRFKGLNIDMEYVKETANTLFSEIQMTRSALIDTILAFSQKTNVLTTSLKKYFDKNSENVIASKVRLDLNVWSIAQYSDDKIELIQYLGEKKIVSDHMIAQIADYKSKTTVMEPALKKTKFDSNQDDIN